MNHFCLYPCNSHETGCMYTGAAKVQKSTNDYHAQTAHGDFTFVPIKPRVFAWMDPRDSFPFFHEQALSHLSLNSHHALASGQEWSCCPPERSCCLPWHSVSQIFWQSFWFSPKIIWRFGNPNHPKLGTIILIVFAFQGQSLPIIKLYTPKNYHDNGKKNTNNRLKMFLLQKQVIF